MKVSFPARIADRHVGGNTTYTRELIKGLQQRGVEVGRIPATGHPIGTAAFETLYSLRRQPDNVLHFSADTGSVLRTRTPSVLTVHGVASRWTNVARNKRQEAVWRYRVGRAVSSADALVTVSQSAADDVSHVFDIDRSRLHVIPHGIDSALFGQRVEADQYLPFEIDSPFVLFLGNLEPRKNLSALIDAFESPAVRQLGVPLVIAGKPAWGFDEILERLTHAQNVVHLGFVSERTKSALLQHCELFVFPSHYEGFGFPVLEAMAASAPVLCSDRGSLAEVMGPSKRIAELDAAGIADAVIAALGDSEWQNRATVDGPKWAAQFSWRTSVERHLHVYEKVAQR